MLELYHEVNSHGSEEVPIIIKTEKLESGGSVTTVISQPKYSEGRVSGNIVVPTSESDPNGYVELSILHRSKNRGYDTSGGDFVCAYECHLDYEEDNIGIVMTEVSDGLSLAPFTLELWSKFINENIAICEEINRVNGLEIDWTNPPDVIFSELSQKFAKEFLKLNGDNEDFFMRTLKERQQLHIDAELDSLEMEKLLNYYHTKKTEFLDKVLTPLKLAKAPHEYWNWGYLVNAPFTLSLTAWRKVGIGAKKEITVTQRSMTSKADITSLLDLEHIVKGIEADGLILPEPLDAVGLHFYRLLSMAIKDNNYEYDHDLIEVTPEDLHIALMKKPEMDIYMTFDKSRNPSEKNTELNFRTKDFNYNDVSVLLYSLIVGFRNGMNILWEQTDLVEFINNTKEYLISLHSISFTDGVLNIVTGNYERQKIDIIYVEELIYRIYKLGLLAMEKAHFGENNVADDVGLISAKYNYLEKTPPMTQNGIDLVTPHLI